MALVFFNLSFLREDTRQSSDINDRRTGLIKPVILPFYLFIYYLILFKLKDEDADYESNKKKINMCTPPFFFLISGQSGNKQGKVCF